MKKAERIIKKLVRKQVVKMGSSFFNPLKRNFRCYFHHETVSGKMFIKKKKKKKNL